MENLPQHVIEDVALEGTLAMQSDSLKVVCKCSFICIRKVFWAFRTPFHVRDFAKCTKRFKKKKEEKTPRYHLKRTSVTTAGPKSRLRYYYHITNKKEKNLPILFY